MKVEYSYIFTSKAKNVVVAKLKTMTVFVYFLYQTHYHMKYTDLHSLIICIRCNVVMSKLKCRKNIELAYIEALNKLIAYRIYSQPALWTPIDRYKRDTCKSGNFSAER